MKHAILLLLILFATVVGCSGQKTAIPGRGLNRSENNDKMIEVAFKQEAVANGLTVGYDNYIHETALFDPDGQEVGGTVYYLTLTHKDGKGTLIRKEQLHFDSYEFEKMGSFTFEWGPYFVRIVKCGEDMLKLKIEKRIR